MNQDRPIGLNNAGCMIPELFWHCQPWFHQRAYLSFPQRSLSFVFSCLVYHSLLLNIGYNASKITSWKQKIDYSHLCQFLTWFLYNVLQWVSKCVWGGIVICFLSKLKCGNEIVFLEKKIINLNGKLKLTLPTQNSEWKERNYVSTHFRGDVKNTQKVDFHFLWWFLCSKQVSTALAISVREQMVASVGKSNSLFVATGVVKWVVYPCVNTQPDSVCSNSFGTSLFHNL